MRCGFRSFRSARFGLNPNATASPPQNGSTNLLLECCAHSGNRRGTSHLFPPAHFNGGRIEAAAGFFGTARSLLLTHLNAIHFVKRTPFVWARKRGSPE